MSPALRPPRSACVVRNSAGGRARALSPHRETTRPSGTRHAAHRRRRHLRAPLLTARGITKTITTAAGDLQILKGVDLDLRPAS